MEKPMSEKEQLARAYYQADDQVVGRNLFGVYMAAILGAMVKNFPEETNLNLGEFVGPTLSNLSPVGGMGGEGLKGTDGYDAEVRIDQMYNDYHARRDQKLRILRGTLIFALKNGLIDSPHSEDFLADSLSLSLRNCSLTGKAYSAIFRVQDPNVEEMIKGVVRDLGGSGEKKTSAPSLFEQVTGFLKKQVKDQAEEQVKNNITDPLAEHLNAILATIFSVGWHLVPGLFS